MAEEKNHIATGAEKEEKLEKIKIPDSLPVLILRDIVVFPYMIVPLYVGRPKSKKAVDAALNGDRLILLLTQKDMNMEDPGQDQLYGFGTVALIVRMLKLPDGRMRVLVQGISRVRVQALHDDGKVLQAEVQPVDDEEPSELTLENKAMIKNLRQKFEQASKLGKQISNEILVIAENIEEPGKLADIIASNLELKIEDSQAILEEANSLRRLAKVHEFLSYEIEMLNMQNQINLKAQGEMDKNQKEYFLRQQLKAIRKELGEESENMEEIGIYLKKLEEARMPEARRTSSA
jgi:ATP-dependent Lon protease